MHQARMKEIFLSDAELDAAMQQLEDSIASRPPVSTRVITEEDEWNALWMNDSDAVDILRSFYPNLNWSWFLVRNRAGLTEGYPKIRFDQNCENVIYKLRDIEDFAEMYGQGKYQLKDIHKVTRKHFDSIPDKEYREVEMRGDTAEDVLGVRSEGDADALPLSREQAFILSGEIHDAAEIQKATGYAVTTLTYALRAAAQAGGTLDGKEVEAFIESAIAVAGRSYGNAISLFELSSAVSRRIGDGYTNRVTVD